MKFLSGVLTCLILIGVGGAFMIYGGRLPIGATSPADVVDKLAPIARDKAIVRNATTMHIDLGAAAAQRGMGHYAENCMPCHGAPGGKPMEFAEGMNPKAPALDSQHSQSFTDGELFWVVKNGIRASAMPGFGVNHEDTHIRDIVAFVRHLPKLTPDEKSQLSSAAAAEHHHDDAAAGERAGSEE